MGDSRFGFLLGIALVIVACGFTCRGVDAWHEIKLEELRARSCADGGAR